MTNRIILIVIGFALSANSVWCQNLGYSGLKTAIGFGLNSEVGGAFVKVGPFATLERSIAYNISLYANGSVQTYKSNFVNLDYGISDIKEIMNMYSDKKQSDIGINQNQIHGVYTSKISTIGYGIRFYNSSSGAIAPYGKFFSFGLHTNIIKITDSDMYINGDLKPFKEPDNYVRINLNYNKQYATSTDVGIVVGFGEKGFFLGRNYFEYEFSLNLDGIKRYSWHGYFVHQMDAARAAVLHKVLNPQIINARFTYGIGF